MMPKFRTMVLETPEVATDKLRSPKKYLTPMGSFLRKSSLDELPQIINLINGSMKLIGARPLPSKCFNSKIMKIPRLYNEFSAYEVKHIEISKVLQRFGFLGFQNQ